jgi:GNAT superfamily N-acetyltransferase
MTYNADNSKFDQISMEIVPLLLTAAPWDSAEPGCRAWQLTEYSPAALALADATPGQQSILVAPTADPRALHQHGFRGAGTRLEAVVTRGQLRQLKPLDGHNMSVAAKIVSIDRRFDLDAALALCRDAFPLDAAGATPRYEHWLRKLAAAGQVYGLFAEGRLAGFIGYSGGALVLQAVAPAFRGRGLAKYWWRQAIAELLGAGHASVSSMIPAANMAALNLYATQGFSFRQPQDLYHRIVK